MSKATMKFKEIAEARYKEMWLKKSDKQVLKEIESYHSYFARYKSSWSDGTSNKDDFTPSDRLLILKEIITERGRNSDFKGNLYL